VDEVDVELGDLLPDPLACGFVGTPRPSRSANSSRVNAARSSCVSFSEADDAPGESVRIETTEVLMDEITDVSCISTHRP